MTFFHKPEEVITYTLFRNWFIKFAEKKNHDERKITKLKPHIALNQIDFNNESSLTILKA